MKVIFTLFNLTQENAPYAGIVRWCKKPQNNKTSKIVMSIHFHLSYMFSCTCLQAIEFGFISS